MTETVALVVAAGRGNRFGGERPKQYATLGGQAVLRHSLRTLSKHPQIAAVAAVIHPDDRDLYDQAAVGLDLREPVAGGATRQISSCKGLESFEDMAPRNVLIHDGARPFVSPAVIDRVLAGLEEADGAIAALPVTDTLKREDKGQITDTLDRAGLWQAQTPQGFRFDAIFSAHRAVAGRVFTDDAAVAEAVDLPVALVLGSPDNIKVTTQDDLTRAERWLADGGNLDRVSPWGETRVGQGYDVHRFGAGDHVSLCGIQVPHDHGLVGHSDADVGLHALTDAILGALGAGDIGSHFPPSDPQWAGADSGIFLRHARDLVSAREGRILHADITLICEAPKIGPRRTAMVARVAELLAVSPDRVSVKATTTEGLGFTGRKEGIAAQAVATLQLPINP